MKKLSLFLFALIAMFACKKSVEGETATWQANKTKLQKLKASFPAFGSVLDEELKEAEKKWEEASKITNEEEKIKKMSEANYTFTTGFVYELSSLESRMESITKKRKDLKAAMTSNDVNLSKSAQREILSVDEFVSEAIASTEKMLAKGDKSTTQAYKTIKEANKTIADAEQKVDAAMKMIESSRKPAKNNADTSKATKKK
jgi:hypothetical protein